MAKAKTQASKVSAKKTSAKAPAPTAKKSATKAKPTSHGAAPKKIERKPAPQLTTEARRKLLKPRENYDDLVERIARTWESIKTLRVPGLTTARLRKLLKNAERAKTKEETTREKLERTLRPLYDGRLLAEDKAWRAVLDVNAAVKLHARNDPAIAETFAFLTEALTTNAGKSGTANDSAEKPAATTP